MAEGEVAGADETEDADEEPVDMADVGVGTRTGGDSAASAVAAGVVTGAAAGRRTMASVRLAAGVPVVVDGAAGDATAVSSGCALVGGAVEAGMSELIGMRSWSTKPVSLEGRKRPRVVIIYSWEGARNTHYD